MAHNISRTLIIGLGGTGQTVIREIKKRMFRRYGEIPPLVRFLAFDTDSDYYQDTPFRFNYEGENRETTRYNLQRDEFVFLHRPSSLEVLKSDFNCQNLNHRQLEMLFALSPYHSSSGYRVLGRAHFLYNAELIIRTLVQAVTDLKNSQLSAIQESRGYSIAQDSVTVYIIASLAGGTGSSAIMDMSRMVQHAGINPDCDRLFGMFFMPSFFSNKPNTPNIRINAYVALSEVDYLLGLNDGGKYPDGCREKENDLNIYGLYDDYKPVRYSNVFLIEEKTQKGHVHNLVEASGYVASFIAASIAADNQALVSSFTNSFHRMYAVDGKKQFYSGLGYCEIRFDRKSFVQKLLNRQIRDILDNYKSGDSAIDMDKIADHFIADNHLDDLADSIYPLDDGRFTGIRLRKTEIGRQTDVIIEKNKDLFLDELSQEATQALQDFGIRKARLSECLKDLLDDCQSRKGFGRFPNLVLHLKNSFENSLLRLKHKIANRLDIQRQIEGHLSFVREEMEDNTKGLRFLLVGRERLVHAIDDYVKSVNQLALLKLEDSRTEEAIKVYEDFIRILDNYYKEEIVSLNDENRSMMVTGTFISIQHCFERLIDLVDSEFSARPSKVAINETLFIDAYLDEYFKSHQTDASPLTDQSINHINGFIGESLLGGVPVDHELAARIRDLVLQLLPEDAMIKRIANYQISLDELFVLCFGQAYSIEDRGDFVRYPQLGFFSQLENLFDPLWQYEPFHTSESQPVTSQFVVGVYDKNNHLFDGINGYGDYLPKNGSYQFIELGEPDRIVFLLNETAIPAFKMRDTRNWEYEYQQRRHVTYAFSDKRLEDIDMIMPKRENEIGEIAWAYGWMFGLIASVDHRIQVKPSKEYLKRNMLEPEDSGYVDCFKQASDLNVCHQEFTHDKVLCTDIYNQVMDRLNTDIFGCIIKIFHWINDGLIWQNRGKLQSSMNEQERLVIQNEPMFLTKRFAKLNSPSVTVKYEEGIITFTDNLGILDEAEKAYQEAKIAE